MMQISKKMPGAGMAGMQFWLDPLSSAPIGLERKVLMELSTMQLVSLLMLGTVIGVLGGMLGIGGGVLVIPALMTLYHFGYKQAVGTSLGMLLPPIGIFAFMEYYRAGNVNFAASMTLAAGFAVGAYFGGRAVTTGKVPLDALRVMFAFFLLYLAGSILFRTDVRVRPTINTLLIVSGAAVAYWALWSIGRRWEKKYDIELTYREQVRVPMGPDYEI